VAIGGTISIAASTTNVVWRCVAVAQIMTSYHRAAAANVVTSGIK
jgi:hypothetical protein